MLVNGRGSILQVQYTGDEAAPEIKRLLDAVCEDEDDYERWEPLVQRAMELEGGVTRNSSPSAIELVRNVFDCFLAKFPLFFGYWKKYADLEFAIGGTETAEMVYERGVSCIPTSVDLWMHYCSFKMDTCHEKEIIRMLFLRGKEFVGLDYQSSPFWDKYLEFEERYYEEANITKIHEELIHIPLHQFDKYFQKFRGFITARPLEEITDTSTLKDIRSRVDTEAQEALALGYPQKSDMEIDREIRRQLDAHYCQVYMRTSTEVSKRWTFESSIKRGYFHVTPVDDAELVNWRKYLDFEESEGDFERIRFLYERCLVACALYEEFWLRYARWMFAQGKEEDTRIIYIKGSCIFVPIAQPTIRLHWARLEEKLGYIQIARDVHVGILEEMPDHVETITSLANLVRRHNGDEAAIETLQHYIDQHNAQIGGQLTAEQARIRWQCSGDVDNARQLFEGRIDKYPDSRDFWLSYMKFEINQLQGDGKEAHARVQKIHKEMRAKASFSGSTMKELSQYYMSYLLDRGGKAAAKEFMLLDKEVNGAIQLQSMAKEEPNTASASASAKEGEGNQPRDTVMEEAVTTTATATAKDGEENAVTATD